MTLGPDGNVWFTMENYPDVGVITPSGTVNYFPINDSSNIATNVDHSMFIN
jgi:streptogramin lyase